MEERWRRSFLLKRTQGGEDSRALPTRETDLSLHALHEGGKNRRPEASFMQTTAARIRGREEAETMTTRVYLIIRIRLHILGYSKMQQRGDMAQRTGQRRYSEQRVGTGGGDVDGEAATTAGKKQQ